MEGRISPCQTLRQGIPIAATEVAAISRMMRRCAALVDPRQQASGRQPYEGHDRQREPQCADPRENDAFERYGLSARHASTTGSWHIPCAGGSHAGSVWKRAADKAVSAVFDRHRLEGGESRELNYGSRP